MADSDNESGRQNAGNTASGWEFLSPREQDRFLPIANVSRIMKKTLPANAKISKEAKETVQECVSEFISFITGEASDKCQREKRKTINGDDLLWAMTTLGFEDYAEPLKLYLHKFRDAEGDKGGAASSSSFQQQQHNDSVSVGNNGGGYGGAVVGGGRDFMMMTYGSSSAASSYGHQMGMSGKGGGLGGRGGGGGGGGGSTSSVGRQGRA